MADLCSWQRAVLPTTTRLQFDFSLLSPLSTLLPPGNVKPGPLWYFIWSMVRDDNQLVWSSMWSWMWCDHVEVQYWACTNLVTTQKPCLVRNRTLPTRWQAALCCHLFNLALWWHLSVWWHPLLAFNTAAGFRQPVRLTRQEPYCGSCQQYRHLLERIRPAMLPRTAVCTTHQWKYFKAHKGNPLCQCEQRRAASEKGTAALLHLFTACRLIADITMFILVSMSCCICR